MRQSRRHSRNISRRSILKLAGAAIGPQIMPSSRSMTFQTARGQSPAATYIDAAGYGLVGDGITDDAEALQSAVDDAAEQQKRLFIPPGRYAVATGIELRTGSFVTAHGATLVTYIPELGDPGVSFPTVRVYDAENVVIHGLEIEGRKDEFAHSQWKHGFAINNSRNVWLYQCHANRCKGDGVILENGNIGDVNIDVIVESCSFGENYRMGGTASGALRAEFRNCAFWGTSGTKPMCGFDVEPDRPDVTCQDISFYHCDFSDNGTIGSGEGYGFNVSFQPNATGPQSGVYLENCTMARNGASGVDLYRVPKDVSFNNCQFLDNAEDGIRIFADATDIVIRGGRIAANGQHGVHCAVEPGAPCQNIEIDSVTISNNGWPGTAAYDGIHLINDVDNIAITNCDVSGSSGYGLQAAESVTNLVVSDTVFTQNAQGSTFPEMDLDDSDG